MHNIFSRRAGVIGILIAYTTLVVLALPLGTAQAHAAYDTSTPAANAILSTDPTVVTIHFKQNLDPKGLSITVFDNKSQMVSIGSAQISNTDPATASVMMKGNGSDIYRVDWSTVSASDGDPTLGAYVFGVSATGASDKVVAASTTTPTTGTSAWVFVLVSIVSLIVGVGVAYLWIGQTTTGQPKA